jgi:hypothetical protein
MERGVIATGAPTDNSAGWGEARRGNHPHGRQWRG